MKALLKSRLWIPIRAVDKEYLETEFRVRNFDDRQCDKCEYRPDRFCDVCAECPAFLGEVKLWREKEGYIGVPTGDRKALKRLLIKPVEIKDSRSKPKMRFGLSLTTPLRDYQKKPVEEMVAKGFGILNAPPRSGKTLMAIAIGLTLGVRMIIMGAQRDWLNQFLTEFKEHTDFLEVAKFHGKPIVLITNSVAQMRASNADVILSTYQSFISKTGKKRLQEIKDLFGLVIIDECHGIPATAYAQVVASFNARYRIGLTATPERKDGKEVLLYKILGGVSAKAHVETLKPKVRMHLTKANTKYTYKTWVYAMQFLYKHKQRNLQIVKQAVADIKAGRHLVIPVGTVLHAKLLTHNINKFAGEKVAEQFTSNNMNAKKREEILAGARSGKLKCLVGTRQLVQVGINVPIWDTLYVVAPISNVPKFTQETARIRTAIPGKPQPMIRHFIEEFSPSVGCLRTCLFHTYLKEKFDIDPDSKKLALNLVSKKKPTRSANFGIV